MNVGKGWKKVGFISFPAIDSDHTLQETSDNDVKDFNKLDHTDLNEESELVVDNKIEGKKIKTFFSRHHKIFIIFVCKAVSKGYVFGTLQYLISYIHAT